MQITVGPGEAIAIVLAIISGIAWIVQSQSKLREAMVRVETSVAQIPALQRSLGLLKDQMHALELDQASQDPHRRRRLHPLTRSLDEHEDEG